MSSKDTLFVHTRPYPSRCALLIEILSSVSPNQIGLFEKIEFNSSHVHSPPSLSTICPVEFILTIIPSPPAHLVQFTCLGACPVVNEMK